MHQAPPARQPAGPQGAPGGSVTVSSGPSADIFLLLSPPSNDLGQLGPIGETNSSASKNQEFALSSFSFDTTSTSSIDSATGGAGAGKVHFEKFQFVKRIDKYSSVLFKDLAAGTVIKQAELVVRKPSATGKELPVVQYVLKDVVLSDLHVSGESSVPTETFQGLYGAISFVVYEPTATGTTKAGPPQGWNQITNRPETSLKQLLR